MIHKIKWNNMTVKAINLISCTINNPMYTVTGICEKKIRKKSNFRRTESHFEANCFSVYVFILPSLNYCERFSDRPANKPQCISLIDIYCCLILLACCLLLCCNKCK